jgi:GTP-binding protein LepA
MIDDSKCKITVIFPLAEIILDFFDKLKSSTQGYASMEYEHCGFQRANIKKLTILIMGEPVDALSFLIHES